jgi:hypothetical protein
MNNCIVIYNNLTAGNGEYQQRVVEITDFYIYNTPGFDLYRTSTLTTTLTDLAKRGYQWAFVNIAGHCVDTPSIYNDILQEATSNNYPMMGHIVFRPGTYPTVDAQFFLINLTVWQQVGSPPFEDEYQPFNFNSVTVERSQEDFHDDYTPYWIRPSEGVTNYTGPAKLFNSQVVRALLEAGYTINNLNQGIRDRKWNLYANYNLEYVEPFFQTGTVAYPQDRVPQIIERILNERDSLSNTVYVLNSEEVYSHSTQFSAIDHYVGVASGFKGILLLNQFGFKDSTQITYVDVSTAGLDYQRYLVETWDGNLDTYQSIVTQYQQQNTNYRYAWRSWNSWNSEIDLFLSTAKLTRDEFQTIWQQTRKLTHNYITVNLLEDIQPLIDQINLVDSQYVYMWLSNAYDMQWTRFLLGKTRTEQQFNNLIDQLKTTDKKYLIESVGRFYRVN